MRRATIFSVNLLVKLNQEKRNEEGMFRPFRVWRLLPFFDFFVLTLRLQWNLNKNV
jgi:hypothetical protein